MNCFNHPTNSALGICRACCKGICMECAADLGHSISCKGDHEERATAIHALSERSTAMLKATRKSRFIGPLFFAVVGGVFLIDGLRQAVRLNFASILGAAFIAFSLAILITNIRAFSGREKQ